METPESIKPHEPNYKANAWEGYTLSELGNWVHLFSKRAEMRNDKEKQAKDLRDASNYLDIMRAYLDDQRARLGA
jgi:hypothetical protein